MSTHSEPKPRATPQPPSPPWIAATWPSCPNVQALTTTRLGGVSAGTFAELNLGRHTGDQLSAVTENRRRLVRALALPRPPCWLNQQHTDRLLNLDSLTEAQQLASEQLVADAAYTQRAGVVCAVLTADCVPILLRARGASEARSYLVAAIHAGWRGILNQVIEHTLAQLPAPAAELEAWLGPAVGPRAFVVEREVVAAFTAKNPQHAQAFTPLAEDSAKARGDLYQIARQCLAAQGVTQVYGGDYCTYSQPELFFSFRRDGEHSGRMASLIWMS